MAENKKISQLNPAVAFTGAEKFEILQGGLNLCGTPEQMKEYVGAGPTREFNRAFSAELLFDKNEIDYTPHTLTGDVTFSVSASEDNLVNEFSGAVQTITVDGSQAISFSGFQFIYGIQNGESPEAGTYQVFFMYRNGVASIHWAYPSLQDASAVQLAAPGDFAAVADGENAIDLSWTNVSGNQGYLIEYSLDGSTGWTTLETTAADATSSTQTGLSAGDTRFYRITTLGNGTSTLNSAYATASAMTEDAGDVTAPTFTFSPTDTATDVGVSQNIVITANESIRKADGTALTDANVADVITLKETDGSGTDIPFTATIDVTKTIITITPTSGYGGNQLVFVEIDGVEDVSGNESAADSITFTTSGYTTFNGTSNLLKWSDLLEPLWSTPDTAFKQRITVRNLPLSGARFLPSKFSPTDNQRSWVWWTDGADVKFTWCRVGTSASRVITWAGVLDSGEHDLELQYDGSIDTNDGLDRATLLIDGVPAGSKSLSSSVGILANIVNTTAWLAFGAGVNGSGVVTSANYFAGEAKDLQILSAGDVVEINIPVLIEGTDTSGNARHGTWVS